MTQTPELDQRIEEARAAKERIDAWEADRRLAAELPQLLAERERQRALAKRRQELAQALEKAREVLATAATETQTWRGRVLELAGDLDGASRETVGALWEKFNRHVDSLVDLQAPILRTRADLQHLAGGNFERLWTDAGGYNPSLAPDFGRADLGNAYRDAIKRRQRGRPIYRPKPIPARGGQALG